MNEKLWIEYLKQVDKSMEYLRKLCKYPAKQTEYENVLMQLHNTGCSPDMIHAVIKFNHENGLDNSETDYLQNIILNVYSIKERKDV